MSDTQKYGPTERDIEQAITALKKGSYLLKYGRRGKPKFCPFQLSNDESTLIWFSGKEERHVKLSDVSRIIPGQRTAIFQRYPRPEKEYQSFSLICSDRSLDLICKDKDEAETWFVGLKALIGNGSYNYKWRVETRDSVSSESPRFHNRKSSSSPTPIDSARGYSQEIRLENTGDNRLGKAFSDLISYTAVTAQPKSPTHTDPVSSPFSPLTAGCVDNANGRTSTTSETVRVSLSSAVSSSSQGSFHEDFDTLGDVFIWGEGVGDGLLGGGLHGFESTSSSKRDALLPKTLGSTTVLDIHHIACGSQHAVLVTKQGTMYSWGEESGGRLGHGIETDVPQPKLINTLSDMHIELIACGEYHTCAVTASGDLFTWGDGTYNSGLLGHGNDVSHWIPTKVSGNLEGLQVSYISCGSWHTAIVTSIGKLFTFGDGTFGALGHGDRTSRFVPREVEALSEYRVIKVACGVWHTAAVVELTTESSSPDAATNSSSAKLFTWGLGDKGCLGHGDKESVLVPKCAALAEDNISQVACGNDLTVILTSAGLVYTTGSNAYGQLGNPKADGKIPALVGDSIADSSVEAIACGSFHVAVLTSKADVYTWGKNTSGQLGHGDNKDRNKPVRVDFLKDKQAKAVACGSNFTAIICPHKWVSSADHLTCSGCRNLFGFRRKRHNCYNCGLVFCKVCSSRKAMKASLAPTANKPYRVCDDCFVKLKKVNESASGARIPNAKTPSKKLNDVVEGEPLGRRLMKQLSKISSSESISQVESVNKKSDRRTELNSSSVFPALNGILEAGSSNSPKLSISFDCPKVRPYVPSPKRVVSSLTSYVPGRVMSPPRSPDRAALDDSKHLNGSLNEEIMSLKAQVEGLTSESQKLKAELEKKSKQLEEVTARAANEAEKCKSANEVIKSLTAQLTEISERLQGDIDTKADFKAPITNIIAGVSNSTSVISHETDPNHHRLDHGDHQTLSYYSQSQLERGHSPRQLEKGQRIVHAESGIYLTLCSLPCGGNELKRVRFSRKRFTEQEAERWWAENGTRICQLHNIQNAE